MENNDKRIPIGKADLFNPTLNFSARFVYEGNLNLEYTSKNFSLDVDLLVKGSLKLNSISFLSSISEKIFVKGGSIVIKNCPLLKSIPIQVTSGKALHLKNDQHLITILSKKQFLSLQRLLIDKEIQNNHIVKNYEEYYSLVEDIILKRKLLEVCL